MTTKRLLAPSVAAGKTPIVRFEMENFARRLHEALVQNRMSQSDLARKVWGSTTDKRGYDVARNRDRISVYLRGESLPDASNMQAIADALGMTVAELAPDVTAAAVERENPEVAMTAIAGHTDKVYLRVNKLVPLALAAKIVTLLADVEK